MDYFLPSFYIQGYVENFEKFADFHHLQKKTYKKGSVLTTPGTINNTSHYICSGIVHLTLTHSSGNQKGIALFGSDTVFPLGVVIHRNLIDYEMILTAHTDIEVYSFSYPLLRQMCVEDGDFAARLLQQNCDFLGYILYQEMNQSYATCYTRTCDFLYIYNQIDQKEDISLTQGELANLVGTSVKQLERVLKELREKKMIETSHRKIFIRDTSALLEECSDDFHLKFDADQ